MKKSEIFDRQHPAPLDRHVYPIYKDFIDLQKEVLDNWKREVAAQILSRRDFFDLWSSRISIAKNSEPVISLKPVVGPEVQAQLSFYTIFFNFYQIYTKKAVELISQGVDLRKAETSSFYIGRSTVGRGGNRNNIHSVIMFLKIIVVAMLDKTLTHDHFKSLAESIDPGDPSSAWKMIEKINDLVKELNLQRLVSDRFGNGGNYFDHPDDELVGSYWRYVEKKILLNKSTPSRILDYK